MNQEKIDALIKINVDFNGAMRRFCSNSDMYEKFLTKFLDDPNYEKIGPAFETGDYDEALTAAHTLKGVSANLGLNEIYRISSSIVDHIRLTEITKAGELLPELDRAYERICAVLSKEY